MITEIQPSQEGKKYIYDLAGFGLPSIGLMFEAITDATERMVRENPPVGTVITPRSGRHSQYVGVFEITPTDAWRLSIPERASKFQLSLKKYAEFGASAPLIKPQVWRIHDQSRGDILLLERVSGSLLMKGDGDTRAYEVTGWKGTGNIMDRQVHNPSMPYKLVNEVSQRMGVEIQPTFLDRRRISFDLDRISGFVLARFMISPGVDSSEPISLLDASIPEVHMRLSSQDVDLGSVSTPCKGFDNDRNFADFDVRGWPVTDYGKVLGS